MQDNNLYEELMTILKSTQDQKLIVDNMIKGKKYIAFQLQPLPDNPNLIKIQVLGMIRTFPEFAKNEIYLPYIYYEFSAISIHDYIEKYLELSLCHIFACGLYDNSVIIDTTKSLIDFKKNKKSFNSHQIKLKQTEKQLNFNEKYYKIFNHLKEIIPIPDNKKYAFILNFDYKRSKLNLKFVSAENFDSQDYLFFIEDKKQLKELSRLFFDSVKGYNIHIERTLSKIELFDVMKNF